MDIECEPRLLEAAVLAAIRGHPDAAAFHAGRDPLYTISGAEDREAAFAALHAGWFQRLALDRPIRQALAEHPLIARRCRRCLVTRAFARRDEAADLLVPALAPATVLLRLTPETLATADGALALLRHELLHVADMLDPLFGYVPEVPSADAAAPTTQGRTERYRVLWAAYVDGRLLRSGRRPPSVRAERLGEFVRAFPELAERAETVFGRFFDAARCTHADLAAVAAGRAAEARAEQGPAEERGTQDSAA